MTRQKGNGASRRSLRTRTSPLLSIPLPLIPRASRVFGCSWMEKIVSQNPATSALGASANP